jgi:hypothetical protein
MKIRQSGFVAFGLEYFLITAAVIAGIITFDQNANDSNNAEVATNSPTYELAETQKSSLE